MDEEDLKGSGVDTEKYLRDEDEDVRFLCEDRDRESESTLNLLNEYTETGGYLNNKPLFRKLNIKREDFCAHPLTLYRELDTLLPTMRDETITSDMMGVQALEYGTGGKKGQLVTWIEAYGKYVDISVRMLDYERVLREVYTTEEGAVYLGERLDKQYQREELMHPTTWTAFLEKYSLLRKRKKQVTQSLAYKFVEMKRNFVSTYRCLEDFLVAVKGPGAEDKYTALQRNYNNEIYNRFATENKTVNSQISEAVFHNLRVKYPHLVSSTKRGMQFFLDKSKEGFKSEQKKEDEKDTLKQQQENSWVGFANEGNFHPISHPFFYRNLMTHVNPNSGFFLEPNDGNTAKPPDRPIIMVGKPGGLDGLECATKRYEKLKKRSPNDWWKCSTEKFKLEMRLMNERSETYGIVSA